MAFKEGETYRCPDRDCGCEIKVIKGAAPGRRRGANPRCCCGQEPLDDIPLREYRSRP